MKDREDGASNTQLFPHKLLYTSNGSNYFLDFVKVLCHNGGEMLNWLERMKLKDRGTCKTCGVALRSSARFCSMECANAAGESNYSGTATRLDKQANRRGGLKASQTHRNRQPVTLPKLSIQNYPMGENMKLYNCVDAGHPGAYIITKFDDEMNVESSYLVSNGECACPRGSAHSCRHRDMLHRFKQYKHIGDGWFLDWDTRIFHNIAVTQTVTEELEVRDEIETTPETPVVEKDAEAVDLPSVPAAPPATHPVGVTTTGAPKLVRRLVR